MPITLRDVTASDMAQIQPIYAHHVLHGAASFEEIPPDVTEMGNRFAALKAMYPQAVGTRSHRNFFGQNIAEMARANGLIYDASTVLWNEPFAQAHLGFAQLVRFGYFWEDGLHLDMGMQRDFSQIRLNTPGIKILNVHPMLQYLNAQTDDQRRAVTSRYRDLTQAPKAEIDADRHRGQGIATLWTALLDWLAEHHVRTHCLRDAAAMLATTHTEKIPCAG